MSDFDHAKRRMLDEHIAGLNIEERSAMNNLIAPAVLLVDDDDLDLALRARVFLGAVVRMLYAHRKLSSALAAAQRIGADG